MTPRNRIFPQNRPIKFRKRSRSESPGKSRLVNVCDDRLRRFKTQTVNESPTGRLQRSLLDRLTDPLTLYVIYGVTKGNESGHVETMVSPELPSHQTGMDEYKSKVPLWNS